MQVAVQQAFLDGPTLSWHGLRIAFRANRQSAFAKIAAILPPGGDAAPQAPPDFVYSFELGEKGQHSLAYLGSRVILRSPDKNTLLSRASAHLERTLAENARDSIFVHAGAVGWRGQAILFPGRSFSGKSTLVRVLLHAGATYLSDEFAVVSAQGLVHPFARPLTLRRPSGKRVLHLGKTGVEIGSHPLPVGAIIFTQYVPGGVWKPQPLSRGQAILELLRNTIAVRSDPTRSIEYLERLTRPGIAFQSVRGEAASTAPLMLETLAGLYYKNGEF